MTLWLVQTIATSMIAVLLSLVFVRRFGVPRAGGAVDVEACLDQLAKIESGLRQGSIQKAEADTARREVVERALASRRSSPLVSMRSGGVPEFALACVAGILIAGAVGFYTTSREFDATKVADPVSAQQMPTPPVEDAPAVKRLAALAQSSAPESWAQPQKRSGLPSVDEMIQRLLVRLEKNPGDSEGWRTLGWSYFNTGQFAEASDAYAKAIDASPGNVELKTARIDAMVRAAGGKITPDISHVIDDVLTSDSGNARARFFKALAKDQQGDKTSALTDCVGLLKEIKPDEPWLPELKSTIAAIERDLGIETATPAAGPNSAISSEVVEGLKRDVQTPRLAENGPSAQDVAAAEAMSPTDRSAMISGMVERLAKRLEQSPRDADGWIKLIRSRLVLGEIDQARQALSRGLEVFADDVQERDRIVASARELGLN